MALTLIGEAANGGELPPPKATGTHRAKPAPGIAPANAGKPNEVRRSGDSAACRGQAAAGASVHNRFKSLMSGHERSVPSEEGTAVEEDAEV